MNRGTEGRNFPRAAARDLPLGDGLKEATGLAEDLAKKYGNLIGFDGIIYHYMVILWDLLGLYGDFMGFIGDFYGDLMGFDGIQ